MNKTSDTNNWCWRPLTDVVFFQEGPGVRKHQYRESGVKLLNGSNINNNALDLSNTARYVSHEEAYGRYKHFLVDEGDLLVASSGIVVQNFATKIAFAQAEHLPLCMNTSTIRFKVKDKSLLDIHYFKRFLATDIFKKQLGKLITGSAQLNFGPSHLKQMTMPVPQIKEQKRISAILDTADAIRRKRQQATDLTERFLRSVFLEMFGDPVTNLKGWKEKHLSELGEIITGNTPSKKHNEYYGDYIEWIKSDNINTPDHFLTKAEEGLSEQGAKHGRIVPPNSILVTCIAGTKECIGNVAIADRAVTFNQQINAVVPNPDINYLFLYTLILIGKKLIQRNSTESMKGLVSKSRFSQIKVPCPPKSIQDEFAEVFQRILSLTRLGTASANRAHNLFDALVQRAFSGGLSAQDVA